MTGLGPEVLDLAQRRWTWAKGTGLGPNALDLQVLPSPAKSSLDLTGNDWTWQENLVHVPPSALGTQVHRLECLGGSRVVIRSGFEATRSLAWRDLIFWATSGGCGQPPRNIMIKQKNQRNSDFFIKKLTEFGLATSRRSRVVPVPNRALSLSVAAISRAIAAVSRSVAVVSRSIAAMSRSIIAAVSRSIAVVGAVSRPIASRSVSDRPIAVAIGEGKWQQAPACRARRHIQTLTKHKAQSATALDDTKPHRTHMTPPPPSPRCHVAASLLCRSRARARARGGGVSHAARTQHAARRHPDGRAGAAAASPAHAS